MQPLITVIVPVYKVEQYLDKCVESIVNQTYKNLEIILVDDGSPDNCPQLCDEWTKRDSRIKVIHKQNGGAASARNMGIDIASGDYITFVDSDDYIEPNMYETMYQNISKDNYDVCVCNVTHIDSQGNHLGNTGFLPITLTAPNIIPSFFVSTVFDSFAVWDKLYKTSIINSHNLRFDKTKEWAEDYTFNYFYFKHIQKMISIEDSLYNYLRDNENSVTSKMTRSKACRWHATKLFVQHEKDNEVNYPIALERFASELMCCLRELLKDNNKELIKECYPLIVSEIKNNYHAFMKECNLSKPIKSSIKLINANPKLFKIMYLSFTKLKH